MMALTKSQRIVIIAWIWSVIVLSVMVLFQAVSLEYYFVLYLIGLLITVELSGPFRSRPKWKSQLYAALVIGMLLFAVLVMEKAWYLLNNI